MKFTEAQLEKAKRIKVEANKRHAMYAEAGVLRNSNWHKLTHAFFVSEQFRFTKNDYLKTYRTFTPISSHSGPGLMKE